MPPTSLLPPFVDLDNGKIGSMELNSRQRTTGMLCFDNCSHQLEPSVFNMAVVNFDKPCFVAQKEQTVDRASYSVNFVKPMISFTTKILSRLQQQEVIELMTTMQLLLIPQPSSHICAFVSNKYFQEHEGYPPTERWYNPEVRDEDTVGYRTLLGYSFKYENTLCAYVS
ncbi:hypothetical protein Tco_0827707 [Tanacetum coccineum]